MRKEYDFSKAKRGPLPHLPPIEELDRHTKVRITMFVDNDVLKFFKARAARPGAGPYQTQINWALREYMEAGGPPPKGSVLDDEGFIGRLAERVAAYAAKGRKRKPSRG
jgi:uncharacterized protein (DUF4415 family)